MGAPRAGDLTGLFHCNAILVSTSFSIYLVLICVSCCFRSFVFMLEDHCMHQLHDPSQADQEVTTPPYV